MIKLKYHDRIVAELPSSWAEFSRRPEVQAWIQEAFKPASTGLSYGKNRRWFEPTECLTAGPNGEVVKFTSVEVSTIPEDNHKVIK